MTGAPTRRKPHSKSRKGCLNCKKRHTKCNEEHPQCANCIRLEITCEWPVPRAKTQNVASKSASREPSSMSRENSHAGSSLPTPLIADGPVFSLADMQLLHHWTTRVYLFHDPRADDKCIWGENGVDVGFQHPFLLHGLLALAALHKTLFDSQADRTSLLMQADTHMSACLPIYVDLLKESAFETVVPCFILSTICFAYNIATAQVEEPADPIGAILHCFRLLQGVSIAIGVHWQKLQQDEVVSKLLATTRSVDQAPLPEDVKCIPILELDRLASELDSPAREACTKAIGDLHTVFVKTTMCSSKKQEHSVIMSWPALLSPSFFNLCHARNHVSIIILTYWAVLMDNNQVAWWVDGWLERLIGVCEELLAAPELQAWLAWPMEMSKHYPARSATMSSAPPSPMAIASADGYTPVNTLSSNQFSNRDIH